MGGIVGAIARKELASLLRDGRLPLLGGALLIAFATLILLSLDQWKQQQQERVHIGSSAREQWDNQGIKNPHRGAHFGLYVFRDTAPLAAIDPGVTPYTGQAIWLEPHRRNITRFQPAADAGPGTRFADPAPIFLLQGALPLLILALTFSQIAGEREQGTLRMLHGVGVGAHQLLGGKYLACFSATLLLVIPMFIALTIALLVNSPDQTSLPAAILLCGIHLLYFAVIAAIGLATASLARDSRTALLLSLAVWALFVIAAPRLGSAVAQLAVPIPTPQEFWAEIQYDYEQGLPGESDLATRVRQFEQALMQQHGVESLEQVPIGVNAARRLMRDAYADRVYQIHFDALWQRYETQANWNRLAALISPTLAVRSLSMLFAGTSMTHQRHFETAAENYRRYFNQTIDDWDMQHTHGSVSAEVRYSHSDLWQSVEPFRYEPPDWRMLSRAALPDLAILLGWTVAALITLRLAGRRLAP